MRVTYDVIFIARTLIDNSYEPISAREFLTVIVKISIGPD